MNSIYVKRVEISALGGIGGVTVDKLERNLTGSSFSVKVFYNDDSEKTILVDFGLHQGSGNDDALNREIPFDTKKVDAVILTHAHIDHSGRIPMLYAKGYNGGLFASSKETGLIAYLQCQNSAKLMLQKYEATLSKAKKIYKDVQHAKKSLESKRTPNGDRTNPTLTLEERKKHEDLISSYPNLKSDGLKPSPPLYTGEDVNKLLINTRDIKEIEQFIPALSVRISNSGHVLGSKSIIMTFTKENGRKKTLVFSGDLGNYNRDFLPNGVPEIDDTIRVNAIFIESTYGGITREKNYYEKGLNEFITTLKKDLSRGKTIFIPAFAYDRTQEVLYHLQDIGVPIYLDGLLAQEITTVYTSKNPVYSGLKYECITAETRESILASPGAKVIVTTSGMMEGGPVVSYIRDYIDNPNVCFYTTGFASPETLANKLMRGDKLISVKVFDFEKQKEEVIQKYVKAKIVSLNFMSGHADQASLIRWLSSWKTQKGAKVFLNHGDINGSSLALKHAIERRQEDGRFNPEVSVEVMQYYHVVVL